MRNPRLLIFTAALSALGFMTLLSAVLGTLIPSLMISKRATQIAVAVLFVVFGVRMWSEGWGMTGKEGLKELEEVEGELLAESRGSKGADEEKGGVGYEDSGDKAGLVNGTDGADAVKSSRNMEAFKNLLYLIFTPVFIQTFVMTFLAEWGDRSQLAS